MPLAIDDTDQVKIAAELEQGAPGFGEMWLEFLAGAGAAKAEFLNDAIIRAEIAEKAARKKKGPGRGWWGPPRGSHTAERAREARKKRGKGGGGEPVGNEVSDQFEVKRASLRYAGAGDPTEADLIQTERRILETLGAIDSVHGVGSSQLSKVEILVTHRLGSAGEFHGAGGGGIKILHERNGRGEAMVAAHEIGHALDFYLVDPPSVAMYGRAAEDRFASKRAWAGGSGTEQGKAVTNVMNAIASTGAYQDIGFYSGKKVRSKTQSGDFIEWTPDSGFIDYLASPSEGFARGYAQYVATRSGNAAMKRDLDWLREGELSGYWNDADFEPVAKAFDNLFEVQGWRE